LDCLYPGIAALENIKALSANPLISTSRVRDDIGKGFRTLHVGRPGRHILLYRIEAKATVLVVRIPHDSMEVSRHLPPDQG
jgi:toxin ParE1/3/4